MTVCCINLLCLLFLVQISKNSIYASPIQYEINEEIAVENDIKFFETEYKKNLDYGEETDEIEDDEDEEHNKIEARLRMFSDEQQDFDSYSIKGDIAFSNGLDGRIGINDLSYRWPSGVIPYRFFKTIKNDSISLIESAIEDWNNLTCINLRPATENDENFIEFHTDYNGCWSFVGDRKNNYKGQPLSLGSGCTEKHTILHELGHAIGLYHEQSRSDRDQTIKVLWENLSNGYAGQFAKANDQNFSTGYDVLSVMQYPVWAFSRKMFELNSVASHKPRLQNLLGKGRKLTFRDLKVVNLLYNCSDTCINKNELNCLNEGYASPGKKENNFKCHCICPPTHKGKNCEEKILDDYYESNEIKFCGGLINKTDQLIEQYANYTPCSWSIEAPSNQFIQIEFTNFKLKERFKSKLNHSIVNGKCLYESLEIRTEDHYNGHHYCSDDIKSGQKFESKDNKMILIVHTYSLLETRSDGFKARIKFFDQTPERMLNRELTTTENTIKLNSNEENS